MKDFKISLTDSQAAKVIAVLRKGESGTKKTPSELVIDTVLSHLRGLVQSDAEKEAKKNIEPF